MNALNKHHVLLSVMASVSLGCSLCLARSASAQTTIRWSVSVPDTAVFFVGDPRETAFSWAGCSGAPAWPWPSGCVATLAPEEPTSVVIATADAEQLGYWSPFDREGYVLQMGFDVGSDSAILSQDAFFQFVGTAGWADPQWRFVAQGRGRTETWHLENGQTLDVTLLPWGGDFRQVAQGALIRVELVLHKSATPQPGGPIKVSTTADDNASNGNCTLREAIIAANTDTAVDQCAAGSGADTIVVPAGTYVLSLTGPGDDLGSTGDLDVASDVTIRGAGAGRTIIDGGALASDWNQDRVLHVLPGASLSLRRVTVQGGRCLNGGGIYNSGTLDVQDSDIRDNVADEISDYCGEAGMGGGAGIYNAGTLAVSRSMVRNNSVLEGTSYSVGYPGGGLLNQGRATIATSKVIDNFGAGGGGIMNYGELAVSDTDIGSNGARFYGAGLQNRGIAELVRTTVRDNVDGGIFNEGGTLTLQNSTVSGNYSARIAGAVISWTGTTTIVSSTIASNRSSNAPGCPSGGPCPLPVAGVYGPVRLRSSIVSNPGYGDCWEPVVSLGWNLDHDGTCGLTAPSDWPNTDPRLGPLADNGGPTLTHALLPGSRAIDYIYWSVWQEPGLKCDVATDQRGVPRSQPRPNYSGCDIGAYEYSPAGDIQLLLQDVMALGARKLLSEAHVATLAALLQRAVVDAAAGRLEPACSGLGDVAATVSGLVDQGSLDPEVAQGLLESADRIRSMLCS